MPLNLPLIIDRFTVETKALFTEHLKVQEQKILGEFKQWGLIEEVESNKDFEDYPSLRSPGLVIEYDEGNVPYTSFGSDTQRVTNRLFGRGIKTTRNQWEDFGNNAQWKSALQRKINDLGTRAINFWSKALADLLLKENDFSSTQDRYSKNIFATDHGTGSNLVNAAAGATQTYDENSLQTEHDLVMDLFCSHTDQDGHDLIREMAPTRMLILCDPQAIRAYQTVYFGQVVPHTRVGTAATDTGGVAGKSNPLTFSEKQGGIEVNIVGWSRLRNKSKTIYVDASGMTGGLSPVVHQVRDKPEMEHDGKGGSTYFHEEALHWKVRMRGELFLADSATKLMEVLKSGA